MTSARYGRVSWLNKRIGELVTELTQDLARNMERASQILAGLTRLASKDCSWLRHNAELHAEILEFQDQLRKAATEVTGETNLGVHLAEAHAVGTQLDTLFEAATLKGAVKADCLT